VVSVVTTAGVLAVGGELSSDKYLIQLDHEAPAVPDAAGATAPWAPGPLMPTTTAKTTPVAPVVRGLRAPGLARLTGRPFVPPRPAFTPAAPPARAAAGEPPGMLLAPSPIAAPAGRSALQVLSLLTGRRPPPPEPTTEDVGSANPPAPPLLPLPPLAPAPLAPPPLVRRMRPVLLPGTPMVRVGADDAGDAKRRRAEVTERVGRRSDDAGDDGVPQRSGFRSARAWRVRTDVGDHDENEEEDHDSEDEGTTRRRGGRGDRSAWRGRYADRRSTSVRAPPRPAPLVAASNNSDPRVGMGLARYPPLMFPSEASCQEQRGRLRRRAALPTTFASLGAYQTALTGAVHESLQLQVTEVAIRYWALRREAEGRMPLDSPELERFLRSKGIDAYHGCTLVYAPRTRHRRTISTLTWARWGRAGSDRYAARMQAGRLVRLTVARKQASSKYGGKGSVRACVYGWGSVRI
jgi:hypothetical protein